ncbi:MAG: glucose-6-phosphate isomerase [Verrucomicrobia bacterium]|nr:glucose-6-phosphate isomerase [Verrucomicrobiota bacterium]
MDSWNLSAIENAPSLRRHLSDLPGAFADQRAYAAALKAGDPLVYTVSAIEPASGEGQLHYALGVLMPGKVGAEFFLTRGHFHAWRAAAEVYVGLRGEGSLLLEDEQTGASRLVPLVPNQVAYVPGHTAHRTINTGRERLVYLGIYPAGAGHDYGAMAERNFRQVVVEQGGGAVLMDRVSFLKSLHPKP